MLKPLKTDLYNEKSVSADQWHILTYLAGPGLYIKHFPKLSLKNNQKALTKTTHLGWSPKG